MVKPRVYRIFTLCSWKSAIVGTEGVDPKCAPFSSSEWSALSIGWEDPHGWCAYLGSVVMNTPRWLSLKLTNSVALIHQCCFPCLGSRRTTL